MSTNNNPIASKVGATISGVTNTFTVTNPSDTASSAARTTITVGGASSADPTLNFNVSGVTDWEMGIDNNASDFFKLSASAALGTTDTFIMTTAGERTMPLQPAFMAVLQTTDTNATGDGTSFTVGSGNAYVERFDQGGDFVTTGTFTAPVSGKYPLEANIIANNLSASFTSEALRIVTSNVTYTGTAVNPGVSRDVNNRYGQIRTTLADMDAGDTATVVIAVSGGTKTVGVRGDIATATSYFFGYLSV